MHFSGRFINPNIRIFKSDKIPIVATELLNHCFLSFNDERVADNELFKSIPAYFVKNASVHIPANPHLTTAACDTSYNSFTISRARIERYGHNMIETAVGL